MAEMAINKQKIEKYEERTAWSEIGPGIYERQIPESEQYLDRQFVERIAEAVDSPSLKQLILETGKYPPHKRQRKGFLKTLIGIILRN